MKAAVWVLNLLLGSFLVLTIVGWVWGYKMMQETYPSWPKFPYDEDTAEEERA